MVRTAIASDSARSPRRPVSQETAIFLTDAEAARLAGHPGRADVRCRQHGGFEPRLKSPTDDVAMAHPLIAAGLAVAWLPSLNLAKVLTRAPT